MKITKETVNQEMKNKETEDEPKPKAFQRVCHRCEMILNAEYKGALVDVSSQQVGITSMKDIKYEHSTETVCIESLKANVLKMKTGICLLVDGMDQGSFAEAQKRLKTIHIDLINGNPPEGKQPVT